MKKNVVSILFILSFFFLNSCIKEKETEPSEPEIKGKPGNPRFNLQFDNEINVDMDLHVLTPSGIEIFYDYPEGDGGTLDIDCLCFECPSGPNENIFWTAGTAPAGTYTFWVEYYGDCGVVGSVSNYTLRVMKNAEVLQTYKGSLNETGKTSEKFTFNFR